jgi:hypothetical protein
MDNFRTDVRISASRNTITHKTAVFTAGSCFADAIGNRLLTFKFPGLVNPFGVSYNPLSIHKTIIAGLKNEQVLDDGIVCNNHIYNHLDYHSCFGQSDKDTLLSTIKKVTGEAHEFLRSAKFAMITYGTSWVYVHKKTGSLVSNCHKIPAAEFERRLLSPAEIVESFAQLHKVASSLNPNLRFILTLSPVRHVRDTLELNSVSKSILRLSIHNIVERFGDVDYFPAYEIMMDDLRDYRFYKADMIHPTEVAEDYIWQKFIEKYMDSTTSALINEWQGIIAAMRHKPFHPSSDSHQQFLKATIDKIEKMKNNLDVTSELESLRSQLKQMV